MRRKYHGTVYANGIAVYEDWYETRRKAVTDLKQEARETMLNSFGENMDVDFTLSLGSAVIGTGKLPARRFYRPYTGFARFEYGPVPIGGTRIC
jgi:hypothetical protein